MTETLSKGEVSRGSEPPRLLIEEWLPAAAIGVECMRERGSASALAPTTFLHVWWARRPLTASRAAVLASLLPADFPRDVFERLLGFGRPGEEIVQVRQLMDTGYQVPGGFGCDRAFKHVLREDDLRKVHDAVLALWGSVTVIDPMAGGGSIPLESARLGIQTIANEYNPVACSALEATIDYPFRHGASIAAKARAWSEVWLNRVEERVGKYFPKHPFSSVHAYIFARTVPCPDTPGNPHTPLVPDWHLLRPSSGKRIVAEPIVDSRRGTWTVRIREIGRMAGQLKMPPAPTYADGKGVSIFSGHQIPSEYIKAKAQAGEMGSALYAVGVKTPQGLTFQPPEQEDLRALAAAEKELARLRPAWERDGIIPTELYPEVTSDERPRVYGMPRWADMFSPRQLLGLGVMVEELRKLRPEIIEAEGEEVGRAVEHLLAFVLDKWANYNSILASWHAPRQVIRSVFDRHDFAFKSTFSEMAPCGSGEGLAWAIDNVLSAYEDICRLPRRPAANPATVFFGSATSMPQIEDGSITAVVVDPPYADNVQYSELADFFYVWLKRTQGHRRPEWFSTYLCDHTEEAVVNVERHRKGGELTAAEARAEANAFYQRLMGDVFAECRRILRDDGVLTVMFTHKKQEAWEALFSSLIKAGFTITATWPVKTESQHSLHQARKNAAQSTVLLVARKRRPGAGVGYFDAIREEIRERARAKANQLKQEGLNAVDQLVGSFGPAMEVYSRYSEVRTDTGEPVAVAAAIDEAADAVSEWRVEQLARRGLEGVEAEGRFALLCWDVLGAAEFRFNEAKLLGHAVGMSVDSLVAAGLVTKSGDSIRMVPARERRRDQALKPEEYEETLFGTVAKGKKKVSKKQALKVHPNDPRFRSAMDGCHALALAYIEAGSGGGGVGAAKAVANQQRWTRESPVAKLMEALVLAAPEAVRHDTGKLSVASIFPEFRAWHALLKPVFGIEPPDWTERTSPQMVWTQLEESLESGEDEEEGDGE
ncbi:MAG: DUF1156 domain-containing protein [Sphingomonadaceae bacterium]